MAILINDNYSLQAENKAFDARYLDVNTPWASCAAAIAGIPTYRYEGLTININNEEWWWKDGLTDGDLVQKTLGGTSNLSGATNGLQLLCSNAYVGLGGILTQDTTICGAQTLKLGNSISGLTALCGVTPMFHIEDDGSNSSISFNHNQDTPHFDVCLYGENADSSADIILDVDNTNGCFIASIAPNTTCCSSLLLNSTDDNVAVYNLHSSNVDAHYIKEACIASSKLSCEAIIDRSVSTDNIKTIMNYDDRSHSFIKDDSIILSILSGGTARYGSNVSLTNDCDLVHKWYVDNAAGSVSGSNGLTRVDDNITLGGVLTGNTTISGASQVLNFGDASSQLNGFYIYNNGDLSIDSERGLLYMDYCEASIGFCADATNNSKIKLDLEGIEVTIGSGGAGEGHMFYADDYSSTYTCLSIPNVGWVTGQTSSSGIQTANNGLTKVGTNVTLGGNLTGNTTINGLGSHNMSFNNISNLSLISVSATTCATTNMLLRTPDFTLHNGVNNVINITSSCNIFTDSTNSEGFVYASNYCAIGKTNPRWIPDNEYITGLTTGGVSTASNGLTKVSTDVKLGGILTENTDICLDTYNLNIENSGVTTHSLAEFSPTVINLCASNINSPFQTGKVTSSSNNTIISNGFTNCYSCVDLANASMNITFCGDNSSFIVTDATTTQKGIEYAADYSSTFVDESLITKRYVASQVSGITTNAITGATNGLTKTGQDVILGGTLTGNTLITLTTGNSLTIMDAGYNHGLYIAPEYLRTKLTAYDFVDTDNEAAVDLTTGTRPTAVLASYGSSDTSTLTVEPDLITMKVKTQDVFTLRDTGVVFESDYSGNYTNLSVVDKCYVDTQINGLTGTTSQSITGATNGLTKYGQDVGLGGILSGGATISGASSILNLGTIESPLFQFYLNTNAALKLSNDVLGEKSVVLNNSSVRLHAETTTSSATSNLSQADGLLLTFSGTSNVAYYDDDYSSIFTPRSLVDKDYVDTEIGSLTGTTSQAITGATNGLTKVGQDVILTGALTQDSGLFGDGHDFQIGTSTRRLDILATHSTGTTTLNVGTANSGVDRSSIEMLKEGVAIIATNSSNSYNGISVGQADMKVTDGINSKGLEYADDYSANYDCLSIPNVGWVTGQTSSSGIHTASNGLTKVGTDVRLGGNLIETTVVSGASQMFYLGIAGSQIGDFGVCNSGSVNITSERGKFYMDTCEASLTSCLDTNNFSEICLDQQGIKVTVCGTDGHMFYADDYSSTYDSRSIVDKEYIDNKANTVEVCQINTVYTTLRNDELIAVSGLSTNEINLYSTPVLGQRLTVVDICGNALADPIVVNGNGNDINDAVCSTINTDYGSVTYVYNGIFWSAVAFIN